MSVDDEWSEFSWGPEKRRLPPIGQGLRRRQTPPRVYGVLAVVIVVMLAAGVAKVAVHQKKATIGLGLTTTTTAPPPTTTTVPTVDTPPGSQRVVDLIDHVTLALPAGWQSSSVTNGGLAQSFKTMLAQDPTLAPLLAEAATALTHVQFGVFAVDASLRSTLYTDGAPAPSGVTSVAQVSTAAVVRQVEAVGGRDVRTSQTQLPVGPATQVSLELTVDHATIAEALDYFVLAGRLVYIVVENRDGPAPVGVLQMIGPTVAAG